MRVTMITTISGSHGDDMWPPAGSSLNVSEREGVSLIRMGVAVQAPDEPEPEKASWPPPAETAVVPEADVEQRDDAVPEVAEPDSPLTQVAPRRGPGRPRKDSLPS
jgi:hypothetical protein